MPLNGLFQWNIYRKQKGIWPPNNPKHLGFSCKCSMKRIPFGNITTRSWVYFRLHVPSWQPAASPTTGHPGKAQHRRSSTTPGAPVTAPSGAHLSDDGPLFNGAQDQGKLMMIDFCFTIVINYDLIMIIYDLIMIHYDKLCFTNVMISGHTT